MQLERVDSLEAQLRRADRREPIGAAVALQPVQELGIVGLELHRVAVGLEACHLPGGRTADEITAALDDRERHVALAFCLTTRRGRARARRTGHAGARRVPHGVNGSDALAPQGGRLVLPTHRCPPASQSAPPFVAYEHPRRPPHPGVRQWAGSAGRRPGRAERAPLPRSGRTERYWRPRPVRHTTLP